VIFIVGISFFIPQKFILIKNVNKAMIKPKNPIVPLAAPLKNFFLAANFCFYHCFIDVFNKYEFLWNEKRNSNYKYHYTRRW
jgi:hypothetical protein